MGAPCWCCRGVTTKVKGLVRPPKLTWKKMKKKLKMENWGSKSKGKCIVSKCMKDHRHRGICEGFGTVTTGQGQARRAEEREQQKEKPIVEVFNSQSHQPKSIPALMTGQNPLVWSVIPSSVSPPCNTDLAWVTLSLPDSRMQEERWRQLAVPYLCTGTLITHVNLNIKIK